MRGLTVYRDVYKKCGLGLQGLLLLQLNSKAGKLTVQLKQGRSEQMYFVMCMCVCNDPRSCICTDFIVYTLHFHLMLKSIIV